MDPYPSVLGRACSTFPYPNDRNVLSRRRSTARTFWFRFCLALFQAVHVDSLIAIIIFTQVLGWSLHDFIQFYRPADCRAAMALARERDGGGPTEEDLKRAALIAEGNRVSLVTRVTLFCFSTLYMKFAQRRRGAWNAFVRRCLYIAFVLGGFVESD